MTLCDFLNPAVPLGERVRHDLGVTFAGACSTDNSFSRQMGFLYIFGWGIGVPLPSSCQFGEAEPDHPSRRARVVGCKDLVANITRI